MKAFLTDKGTLFAVAFTLAVAGVASAYAQPVFEREKGSAHIERSADSDGATGGANAGDKR